MSSTDEDPIERPEMRDQMGGGGVLEQRFQATKGNGKQNKLSYKRGDGAGRACSPRSRVSSPGPFEAGDRASYYYTIISQ